MLTSLIIVLLLVLLFTGMPLVFAIGTASMTYFWFSDINLALLTQRMTSSIDSFLILAIPFFFLAGELMNACKLTDRIINLARVCVGHIHGGLAQVNIFASLIFSGMSGSPTADTTALGSVLIPAMKREGYPAPFSAAVTVASSMVGPMVPPSVSLVIYGTLANVSVGRLLLAGIVPGGILAMALAGYIWIRASLNPSEAPRETEATHWGARLRSLGGLWHAALLVLLVLGVIYSGVATPSEAGAFGALGALALAALVFRSLTWMRFWQIIASSARISGAILLIMGSARIFGDYLNLIRLPDTVSQALTQTQLPTFAILMVVMIALLFLGMLIDAVSLIVVTTPILLPLITALGYDPLWFGIILVMNLEMAVITPPVGLNLYTLKAVAPVLAIEDIIRSVLPFVILQFLVLAMFVLVPEMALWLPGLMP